MRLRDGLAIDEKLALAALVHSPTHVAMVFAQHALQVPRADFVILARRVDALYREHSARNAARFRARLDQRLRERDEPPILWSEP
jgi:hypothetical protein